MKKILLSAIFLASITALAAGVFVAPKSVQEKHQEMNEPAQKAIIVYDAGQEDLILQVKYKGPANEFGWLIPVPNLPTVQDGSIGCFYELNEYAQRHFRSDDTLAMSRWMLGIERHSEQPPGPPPLQTIETNTVGAYKVTVLPARDSRALEQWLADNHFSLSPGRAGVLDSYVQQHWYFVAVKVSLGPSLSAMFGPVTAELNPLQISFATDRCVFPLKISSLNDKPSEAQVYVLSPEPLVEPGMLEKVLPTIYTNDAEVAMARATQFERFRMNQRNSNRRFMGASEPDNSPLSPEDYQAVQGTAKTLMPAADELIPCAKVTKADLPECSAAIPRLANNTWWLTKQTWTLQPDEMNDLEFEPAWSVFAELLGTRYGYFADASLTSFGADGIPAILAAMQNTNATVRVTSAAIFYCKYGGYTRYGNWQPDTGSDPRITDAAVGWLKDPEPDVRMAGIFVLSQHWNPKFTEPLIAMIYDKDADVRSCATAMLGSYNFVRNVQSYTPLLEEMLKDKDPAVRGSTLQILQHLRVQIPRDELVSFFNSSDYRVLDAAFAQLRDQGDVLSGDDVLVLLHNPEPVARILALGVLAEDPTKQSVELALPLLQDPQESIRLKANQTLRNLTGQNFTEQQTDEWIQWWDQNQAHYVPPPEYFEAYDLPNGDAYQERGCKYYDVGNLGKALADFRKSCQLGSDAQDYSYFRIWLIRSRLGENEAATQELAAWLKTRKAQNPPDWPLQVGRFLAGQITEADFFKVAANSDPQTGLQQHCEAYFYAGSKRLIENDRAGAADLFKKCLGTGVNTFEEYDSAEAELKVLN